ELFIGVFEEPAHTIVMETKNRLEIAASRHLAARDHVIALLGAQYMGPEQAAKRLIPGKRISRGNRQLSAAGQVNPVKVAHQRHVVGRCVKGEPYVELVGGLCRLTDC